MTTRGLHLVPCMAAPPPVGRRGPRTAVLMVCNRNIPARVNRPAANARPGEEGRSAGAVGQKQVLDETLADVVAEGGAGVAVGLEADLEMGRLAEGAQI